MYPDAKQCPGTDVLSDYSAGRLSQTRLGVVAAHLEQCAGCLQTLQGLDESHDPLVFELRQPALLPAESYGTAVWDRLAERVEILARDPQRLLSDQPPERVGPYQILERLGEGGMGTVWKARLSHLGKIVALKLLPAQRSGATAVARFLLEMKAVGRLNHPNIVQAYDAAVEGVPYLAMEYLDGTDLAKFVKRRGPLPVAEACACVRQAALGLQHAHEHGMVHRDLKPSNLMLTRDGVVKVLDLGLARLRNDGWHAAVFVAPRASRGAVVGTVDYIAPEQLLNSDAVDIRADLYSLGCTLYHLLTGVPPFAGPDQTLIQKQRDHLLRAVPALRDSRSDVPTGLPAVLDRLLAKAPADRFATPAELARALEPYAAGADLRGLYAGRTTSGAGAAAAVGVPIGRSQPPQPAGLGAWVAGAGVVLLGCVLALAAARWLGPTEGPAGPTMAVAPPEVCQFRAGPDHDFFVGKLGPDSAGVGLDEDSVRVVARLPEPASCYLLAFRPDGAVELCYPAAEDEPPAPVAEINYPPQGARPLRGGGVGLQAFVLVASRKALPAYSQWKAEHPAPPWCPTLADGVWAYDGLRLERTSRDAAGGRPPTALANLCSFFQDQPGVEAVSALAFPVRAQAPPVQETPNP
jgi:tRNA A-37 threonylcarbamoyl transferase component Bud32